MILGGLSQPLKLHMSESKVQELSVFQDYLTEYINIEPSKAEGSPGSISKELEIRRQTHCV